MNKNPAKWVLLAATFFALVSIFQNCAKQLGTDTGNPLTPGRLSPVIEPPLASAPPTADMALTLAQGLAMQLCNRATLCNNINDFDVCFHNVKTNQTFSNLLTTVPTRDLNELDEKEKSEDTVIPVAKKSACLQEVQQTTCQALEGLEDARTDLAKLFRQSANCRNLDQP